MFKFQAGVCPGYKQLLNSRGAFCRFWGKFEESAKHLNSQVLADRSTGNLALMKNIRLRHLPVTKTFRYTKLWDWFVF